MPRLGIFRTSTGQTGQTRPAGSAIVTRRQTTTATQPIAGSASTSVVNISRYSTVRGAARQGITPKVTGLKNTTYARAVSSAGSATKPGATVMTPGYRSMGGLFR